MLLATNVRRLIAYNAEQTRGTRGSIYCFFSDKTDSNYSQLTINTLGTDSKRIYTVLQIASKKQSVWLLFCTCKSVSVCGFVWVRVCMICLLMTLDTAVICSCLCSNISSPTCLSSCSYAYVTTFFS